MKYGFLFLAIILLMPAACRSQSSADAISRNSDEQAFVGNSENRFPSKSDEQKTEAVPPRSVTLGELFENECYRFDASGLKQNEEMARRFRYQCETSFNLDVPDYSPAIAVREYTYEQASRAEKIYENFYLAEKFDLAKEVRRKVAEMEKSGYTVKVSTIKLAGAPAARIDAAFTCPDKQLVRKDSDFRSRKPAQERVKPCQPNSISKAFAIIIDANEKLSVSGRNKKIPGFYLGGQINKPEQEAALERIIKSWLWK